MQAHCAARAKHDDEKRQVTSEGRELKRQARIARGGGNGGVECRLSDEVIRRGQSRLEDEIIAAHKALAEHQQQSWMRADRSKLRRLKADELRREGHEKSTGFQAVKSKKQQGDVQDCISGNII
jgi:hypothetical protein